MRETPRLTRMSGRQSQTASIDPAATRAPTRRRRRPTRESARSSPVPLDGCRVRHTSWIEGNRKYKGRAGAVVGFCPEAALMSLDNRTAHGQTNPHATGFGRVKGIEHLVDAL